MNFKRLHLCEFFNNLLLVCYTFVAPISVMLCCSCNGCNVACKHHMLRNPVSPICQRRVNTLPLCVNSLTDLSHHCVLSIVSNGLVNQTRYGLTDDYVSLAVEVNNS